jgi:hypothetical protein
MGFGCALGIVLAGERIQMRPIGLEVFGGHDYDLAGESVAEGVQGRSFFASGGFGAGGVLGICFINFGPVDFDL